MCSITDSVPAPVTVAGFARLVGRARLAVGELRDALAADPSLLAELPDELLESSALDLHALSDAAGAVATVVTGRLEREVGGVRGKLIAGRYPSTARFLEVEAGMPAAQARAVVARARDLDTHSTDVADAWLAGRIKGGAVRDLTAGVTDVLRRCARTDTRLARREALEALLPLAERGDLRELGRAVAELRLRVDPDGGTEEALHAYENQSLSLTPAGSMVRISGWLTPEAGAATATVLERAAARIGAEQVGGVEHGHGCALDDDPASECSCGALDRARRAAGLRHDHLLARALGETMTDRLGDADLGTHHRVAPHLTVVADLTDLAAPLIGRLALPGSDDGLALPAATLGRLLCDADVTRVVTTTAAVVAPDDAARDDEDGGAPASPEGSTHDDDDDGEALDVAVLDRGALEGVRRALEDEARSVLYVGRAERTVPARLRRGLEARDRHCVFPGCRAHPRRCHAHHVQPWEAGGATDLPNTALLCVAHHHAVHEGGWAMALRTGSTGHEQACWEFEPPLRRRRLRP